MAQEIFVISAFLFALLTLVLSNADHSDLLERQKKLDTKIEQQLKTIDQQIKHLDWYFKVGYTHEGDEMMMDDIDEFVSNPINTFTMIKRLTLYWPSVRDHLFNQTLIDQWDDFLEEVQSFNELLLADQKS